VHVSVLHDSKTVFHTRKISNAILIVLTVPYRLANLWWPQYISMVALAYFYGGLSTVFKYCCPFGVTSALFTSGSLKWHTSGLDFRLFLR
jgi:hypothetical protein